nr:immunoglobulin light chain junction region [Macaca mulatta]
CQYGYGIVFTF